MLYVESKKEYFILPIYEFIHWPIVVTCLHCSYIFEHPFTEISGKIFFLKFRAVEFVPYIENMSDSSLTRNCLANRNEINTRNCVHASLLHLRLGCMDGWVNDVTTSIRTALTLMSLSFNNPHLHPSFPCPSSFSSTFCPPNPDSHISCPGNIHP